MSRIGKKGSKFRRAPQSETSEAAVPIGESVASPKHAYRRRRVTEISDSPSRLEFQRSRAKTMRNTRPETNGEQITRLFPLRSRQLDHRRRRRRGRRCALSRPFQPVASADRSCVIGSTCWPVRNRHDEPHSSRLYTYENEKTAA